MISYLVDPRDQLLDILSYPNLWFEYGLSSNQIRTNDVHNVVLLVVESSSIHHYIFWAWPMLFPCLPNFGIPSIWKPGWIVAEPIDNNPVLSMILLSIKLVLETFISIIFMSHAWSICSDERSDFLWFTCIWCKLPPWIQESLFLLLWNHPKLVMHVRSILWFDRLIIFILYVSLAHKATDWFVQGEEVLS